MVKQYPYQLWVRSLGANAVPDGNGNYSGSTTPEFVLVSSCRDEMNGKGATITLEDQTTQVYDFLIQLPLSCPDVQTGTSVKVTAGSMVRVFGTAKRFVRGQLHCQLFV